MHASRYSVSMNLTTPTAPPFDLSEWASKPFAERARMSVQAFGLIGSGMPLMVYVYYALKLAWYWAMWVFFCSFTEGLGSYSSASWWLTPIAFKKAIAWTTLYEVMGFGCGSGPLTGRIKPTIVAYRHWLRPGTTKLPLFEGAPVIGSIRRTPLDVALYVALLVSLVRALIAPDPGFEHWLPIIVVLPILGVLDKPIFLAARGEHYWVTMVVFAFAGNWIAGAMVVQLALWLFAGVSKLNAYFPTVIAVMTSNSPFTPFEWLRRSMFRDYPNDMRPSKHAAAHAIAGATLELGLPTVMLLALYLESGLLLIVGLVMVVALHSFIVSNVPVGVPIEWNFMVAYGAFFLFGQNPHVLPHQVDSAPVSALLALTCLVIPIYGNFVPSKVSFLLAMRYYAGNWPTSVWLFKGDSYRKLDKLTKTAAWIEDQIASMQSEDGDEDAVRFTLHGVVAFRLLHLHGRAIHSLLPELVDDIDEYTWADGETIAGLSLGWNFGEGHLHNEQLARALQAQCGFEPGEVRCIFLEAQPLFGSHQAYRLYDLAQGELSRGDFPVSKMKELQPWPAQ